MHTYGRQLNQHPHIHVCFCRINVNKSAKVVLPIF
nr:transposase [Serratia quinivorans]